MPKNFIIRPFLDAHKAELSGMLLTEYNDAEAMELFRQEGVDKTRVKSIKNLMKTLKFTAQQAMDALLIPKDDQINVNSSCFSH